MTIEQIKASLAELGKNIQAKRVEMAGMNVNEQAEEITNASKQLNAMIDQRNALQAQLDEETGAQAKQLQTIKSNKDAVEAAGKKFHSLGDFLGCVARADAQINPRIDSRLGEYMNVRSSASGQNITTDAEGGYLVPPDFAEGLLRVAASESVLFGDVSRIPVAGNRLVTNMIKTDSRKDYDSTNSIVGRNGGLLAYWKAEAAELAATTMTFEQDTTVLNKLTGLCYATDEMLEDAPALAAYIAEGFADEFTWKIDDAIMNGTGSGMPTGILAAGNGALVTVAKESGQAAGTINVNNIFKMWNSMPAKNRTNAKWYINQDVEILLYQMLLNTGSLSYTGKDSDAQDVALSLSTGMPIFLPANNSLADAPHGTLLGRPIVPIDQCAAVGAKGDIVLADLSQYRWIDKSALSAETSIHVRFVYDEMAFRFTYRAGGKPIWKRAIAANAGSTSRSPYVCLAART